MNEYIVILAQVGIVVCLFILIYKKITYSEPIEYEDDYGNWREI